MGAFQLCLEDVDKVLGGMWLITYSYNPCPSWLIASSKMRSATVQELLNVSVQGWWAQKVVSANCKYPLFIPGSKMHRETFHVFAVSIARLLVLGSCGLSGVGLLLEHFL